MTFRELGVNGAFLVELDLNCDERGWFARSWCAQEFEARGLNARIAQCNVSLNNHKGTLRGLHYQDRPYSEAKVVRCTQGAIFDVVVDLRNDSPTFQKWAGIELSGENRKSVYVPEGCAHGFLTLADSSEVTYLMSEFYRPELSRGVRWDDPAFGIAWPAAVEVISDRDRSYPNFK